MRSELPGARLLCALLAGAVLTASAPAIGESMLDKLKKQAKDTVEQNKKQAKQTVQEAAAIDETVTPSSLRADLERMWQECYAQSAQSTEYRKCASICNAASKSILDSTAASAANQTTYQKCKISHGAALGSAPTVVQTEKEKQLQLPAGALPKETSTPAAKKPAATPAAAVSATSVKPAAKPVTSPVPANGASPNASVKSDAAAFANECQKFPQYSDTYDCKCLGEKYLTTSSTLYAQQRQEWDSTGKAYAEDRLARAKKMAAEKGSGTALAYEQKRYDEAVKASTANPPADVVKLYLFSKDGEGKQCLSSSSMVQSQTEQCLNSPMKKTALGTPRDATFCACYGKKYAAMMQGDFPAQAASTAINYCDPKSPLYMK